MPAGLGVIVDWVPAHFPDDPHALGQFDGTALYEHANPLQGRHLDWGTLIYNFGRIEVTNFLVANALFWLDRYGIDGLRVDAVASMLYLDYSRPSGGSIPNRFGGRENLEAMAFLRRTNTEVYGHFPAATTIAEESTAWPQVSQPVDGGGLGFGYKWNMGWMHDSLDYISKDPIYRRHHHGTINFALHYAFSENFVLPLSHDEVVHGKRSILGRMPGDDWQRFANLRAFYGYMFAHPGKKLLFMGCEFGQEREWNHDRGLDWHLLDQPLHAGVQRLIRDLNRCYREIPALHELDCDGNGFEWIVADDADRSVFVWMRKGRAPNARCLAIMNFTPEVRRDYRVKVPFGGPWREVLNTDADDLWRQQYRQRRRGGCNHRRRWRRTQSDVAAARDGAVRAGAVACGYRAVRHILLARLGTAAGSTSRCSPPMPRRSICACLTAKDGVNSSASSCRSAPRTSGMSIVTISCRASSMAIACMGRTSRKRASASIRTSCCSTPMPSAWRDGSRGVMPISATAWEAGAPICHSIAVTTRPVCLSLW